jgi:hypothetical protein
MSAFIPRQTILEPTSLGSAGPVLALVREGATREGLVRGLARAQSQPQAILVEGPVPLDWLDAIRTSGAEVWLILRNRLEDKLQGWVLRHKEQVRVMLAFLPGAPNVSELLVLLDTLKGQGVRVQVSVEPLIAGITDTRTGLTDLLAALATRGLKQVTMGYLALDAETETWLQRTQGEAAVALLAQYREGPAGFIPGRGRVRLLPRARRQRGYAGLLALAAEHGLTVCISPLANPDFARPRERTPAAAPRPRLSDIYLAGGRPRPHEAHR